MNFYMPAKLAAKLAEYKTEDKKLAKMLAEFSDCIRLFAPHTLNDALAQVEYLESGHEYRYADHNRNAGLNAWKRYLKPYWDPYKNWKIDLKSSITEPPPNIELTLEEVEQVMDGSLGYIRKFNAGYHQDADMEMGKVIDVIWKHTKHAE